LPLGNAMKTPVKNKSGPTLWVSPDFYQ